MGAGASGIWEHREGPLHETMCLAEAWLMRHAPGRSMPSQTLKHLKILKKRKNQPKEEVFRAGYPADIRGSFARISRPKNFGQGHRNPGKTSMWARTSMARRRGRPRPQGRVEKMRPTWPFWKHRAPKMRLVEAQCSYRKHCYPETRLGSPPTSGVSQHCDRHEEGIFCIAPLWPSLQRERTLKL